MASFEHHRKFKFWGLLGVIIVIAIFIALLWLWQEPNKNEIPAPDAETDETSMELKDKESETEPEPDYSEIPTAYSLEVPFSSQAPFADWGQPYQDACEEASVLNVHYFYEGKTFTKETANQEILDFIDFEKSYLGFYRSTTVAELAEVTKEYLGYDRIDVIENPTPEDIKYHISKGRPVIVPAAGRKLGNPNFTPPGPLYHMYVIKGYDEDFFYTNDVGTRMGNNYCYNIETVMSSISDWDGVGDLSGEKRVLVIYPK